MISDLLVVGIRHPSAVPPLVIVGLPLLTAIRHPLTGVLRPVDDTRLRSVHLVTSETWSENGDHLPERPGRKRCLSVCIMCMQERRSNRDVCTYVLAIILSVECHTKKVWLPA